MAFFDGAFPYYMPQAEGGFDGAFPMGMFSRTLATGFIAEILIGSEVVWSATNDMPQQRIKLDVHNYTGILPLTFRITGQ